MKLNPKFFAISASLFSFIFCQTTYALSPGVKNSFEAMKLRGSVLDLSQIPRSELSEAQLQEDLRELSLSSPDKISRIVFPEYLSFSEFSDDVLFFIISRKRGYEISGKQKELPVKSSLQSAVELELFGKNFKPLIKYVHADGQDLGTLLMDRAQNPETPVSARKLGMNRKTRLTQLPDSKKAVFMGNIARQKPFFEQVSLPFRLKSSLEFDFMEPIYLFNRFYPTGVQTVDLSHFGAHIHRASPNDTDPENENALESAEIHACSGNMGSENPLSQLSAGQLYRQSLYVTKLMGMKDPNPHVHIIYPLKRLKNLEVFAYLIDWNNLNLFVEITQNQTTSSTLGPNISGDAILFDFLQADYNVLVASLLKKEKKPLDYQTGAKTAAIGHRARIYSDKKLIGLEIRSLFEDNESFNTYFLDFIQKMFAVDKNYLNKENTKMTRLENFERHLKKLTGYKTFSDIISYIYYNQNPEILLGNLPPHFKNLSFFTSNDEVNVLKERMTNDYFLKMIFFDWRLSPVSWDNPEILKKIEMAQILLAAFYESYKKLPRDMSLLTSNTGLLLKIASDLNLKKLPSPNLLVSTEQSPEHFFHSSLESMTSDFPKMSQSTILQEYLRNNPELLAENEPGPNSTIFPDFSSDTSLGSPISVKNLLEGLTLDE